MGREDQAKYKTRSTWLNCTLWDCEAVYWASIGHYEVVAVGNWWYWVSRGHLCLYILNKVEIWTGVTDALLTDWLTTDKNRSTQLPIKYKSWAYKYKRNANTSTNTNGQWAMSVVHKDIDSYIVLDNNLVGRIVLALSPQCEGVWPNRTAYGTVRHHENLRRRQSSRHIVSMEPHINIQMWNYE